MTTVGEHGGPCQETPTTTSRDAAERTLQVTGSKPRQLVEVTKASRDGFWTVRYGRWQVGSGVTISQAIASGFVATAREARTADFMQPFWHEAHDVLARMLTGGPF